MSKESTMSEYEDEPRLYADIKTTAEHGGGLVVRDQGSLLPIEGLSPEDVSAVEQGRRQRPDGTVEDYQRVEFRGD
jgi:hypothetical protein